jgi:hypothetical protein
VGVLQPLHLPHRAAPDGGGEEVRVEVRRRCSYTARGNQSAPRRRRSAP